MKLKRIGEIFSYNRQIYLRYIGKSDRILLFQCSLFNQIFRLRVTHASIKKLVVK